MNFRSDILQAVRDETGETYEQIASRTGIAATTLCDVINERVDPRVSTVKAVFRAMRVDPKYAMNFNISKTEFRRAVVDAAR
jgi:transcriptional regulator with XRE-family HTH domain